MSCASEPTVKTPAALRPLYRALGVVCVGIGFINYFIPGFPSTVFFLIALWAFKRSSPRMEHWLLHKSPLGPTLRDWEETKSMTMRVKIVAIASVWVGIGSSMGILIAKHRPLWVSALLFVIAVCLTVYLGTRKTKVVSPVLPMDSSEESAANSA